MKKNGQVLADRVRRYNLANELFNPEDNLLVAVSGGADSTAMLHLLHGLLAAEKIFVLYINHGLRPKEYAREILFVKTLCRQLGVHFNETSVDTKSFAGKHKLSLEDAARRLRYKALEEERQTREAVRIAVGHTSDDQVEEFFLRLLRGCGLSGLSGMLPVRDRIIRPILCCNRFELEAYLTETGLAWCIDSSNVSRQFLRNRVRLDLLPFLEERFTAKLRKRVLQTMDILSAEENYLTELASELFNKAVKNEQESSEDLTSGLVIHKIALIDSHKALQRRIVEMTLVKLGVTPSYESITKICRLLYQENSSSISMEKELHLPDGLRLYATGSQLVLTRPLPPDQKRGSLQPLPSYKIVVDKPKTIFLQAVNKTLEFDLVRKKDTGPEIEILLDSEAAGFPLVVRPAQAGERFRPCNGRTKKIFRFLSEKNIAPQLRKVWPVIEAKGRIAAVAGLAVAEEFCLTDQTTAPLSVRLGDA